MERTDWIENRILWRLKQFGPVMSDVVLTDSIPRNLISEIAREFPDMLPGRPVIAFIERETWTVLTTELIASNHSGHTQAMNVYNEFSIVSPVVTLPHEKLCNAKSELDSLTLAGPDSQIVTIWAPKGPSCFALWNILRMFPFRESTV